MTADDVLALNTILEARPYAPFWDGFTGVFFSVMVAIIGIALSAGMSGSKSEVVGKLWFAPIAAACAFALFAVPSGFASSATARAAHAEWDVRPERTGACARLAAAVEAGRVRWLDAPAYRTFAKRCGRDVSISAANAEGVNFAVGETDATSAR